MLFIKAAALVLVFFASLLHICNGLDSCENVDNGYLIGTALPDNIIMNITTILDLKCICQTVQVDGIQMEQYMGVRGALIPADCGALRFFARDMAAKWKAGKESGAHNEPYFKYVETGSYMGLSAHIITSSVLKMGVPMLTYCHDLFNDAVTEIWQQTGLHDKTNLQRFYDNVKRNNYIGNIIPIIGESWKTLNIHDDNSVDLVFIDGDHTFEGALQDIREGFRILKPGGYLVGHDCVPDHLQHYHEGMGLNGVERALKQFKQETGFRRYGSDTDGMSSNPWAIVFHTGYMFFMIKA